MRQLTGPAKGRDADRLALERSRRQHSNSGEPARASSICHAPLPQAAHQPDHLPLAAAHLAPGIQMQDAYGRSFTHAHVPGFRVLQIRIKRCHPGDAEAFQSVEEAALQQ